MVENYAYVTLLYPNKNGDCTYLDGAILTAFGLRKQNIKYPLICMITNDVKQDTIDILKILYDDIKIVDYISPVKKINQITITSDIFSKEDYTDDENYKEIIKVFTKLHIFNSDLFNFDKILFVDYNVISGLEGFVKTFKQETSIICKYLYAESFKQIEKEKNIDGEFIVYKNNVRYNNEINKSISYFDISKAYSNELLKINKF